VASLGYSRINSIREYCESDDSALIGLFLFTGGILVPHKGKIMDNQKQQILDAVKRELEHPKAKHKLISNALPSFGKYWTAIFISRPTDTLDVHDKCKVCQDIHESDSEQSLQEIPLAQADGQHNLELVCHSTDKDALLGLCQYLLVDAIFRLWSYSDSLSNNESITQNTYTVKG
jgi:hypothetical protein